jgi:ABC-type polar amino acid transport system ATPase subunit
MRNAVYRHLFRIASIIFDGLCIILMSRRFAARATTALAMAPAVVLFGETTSALDPERVGEALEVIRRLALHGMTMVVATRETAFAREVARRVGFTGEGQAVEKRSAEDALVRPRSPTAPAVLVRPHGTDVGTLR